MAFGVQFEVDKASLKIALDNLQALPKKRIRPAVRQATNAAAREVSKAAKSLAPRRTGHLRGSIGVRLLTARETKRKGLVLAVIGPRFKKYTDGSNPGKYGHLVEGGAQPHKIFPVRAKALAFDMKARGQKRDSATGRFLKATRAIARSVSHPGITERRFLRRAAHHAHGPAIRAFVSKVQAVYDKYGGPPEQ